MPRNMALAGKSQLSPVFTLRRRRPVTSFLPEDWTWKAARCSTRWKPRVGWVSRFTPGGILLRSGRELPADIVVTATGLNMLPFGHVEMTVDGEPVRFDETVAFRAMMLSGVPNFAFALGYVNVAWTLKVGLVAVVLITALVITLIS